jgi:hypothetical protein
MRNKLRRETLIGTGPATHFFSRGLSPISQEKIKEIGAASAEIFENHRSNRQQLSSGPDRISILWDQALVIFPLRKNLAR